MPEPGVRSIKFRAWSGKEMRTDFAVNSDGTNTANPRWKIMQFTGLKDKNGKEICEGDIFVVRSLHDGDEDVWNQESFNKCGEGAIPQLVKWDNERFGFEFGRSSRIKYEPYDFEVIGNIFENQELLEAGRE